LIAALVAPPSRSSVRNCPLPPLTAALKLFEPAAAPRDAPPAPADKLAEFPPELTDADTPPSPADTPTEVSPTDAETPPPPTLTLTSPTLMSSASAGAENAANVENRNNRNIRASQHPEARMLALVGCGMVKSLNQR
jgi:hypothetical protein